MPFHFQSSYEGRIVIHISAFRNGKTGAVRRPHFRYCLQINEAIWHSFVGNMALLISQRIGKGKLKELTTQALLTYPVQFVLIAPPTLSVIKSVKAI